MEVSEEALRTAVAANRSWRGVLRAFELTSPRTGRELKARCDVLGIDYGHFGAGGRSDAAVREAVEGGTSWADVLRTLGYAPNSGSARAAVRRRCAQLGIPLGHLTAGPAPEAAARVPSLEHLSSAAPLLAAARITLCGDRVMWPLEPAPYDLVVMRGDRAVRVQVKSTTSYRFGSWQCILTHSTYDPSSGRQVRDVYLAEEVDEFAVVDGDLEVYVIPHAVVAGLTGITLRHYEAFRLARPA